MTPDDVETLASQSANSAVWHWRRLLWIYEREAMQVLPEDHEGIGDKSLDQGYIVTPAVRNPRPQDHRSDHSL